MKINETTWRILGLSACVGMAFSAAIDNLVLATGFAAVNLFLLWNQP